MLLCVLGLVTVFHARGLGETGSLRLIQVTSKQWQFLHAGFSLVQSRTHEETRRNRAVLILRVISGKQRGVFDGDPLEARVNVHYRDAGAQLGSWSTLDGAGLMASHFLSQIALTSSGQAESIC